MDTSRLWTPERRARQARVDALQAKVNAVMRSLERHLTECAFGVDADSRVRKLRASVLNEPELEPQFVGLAAWLPKSHEATPSAATERAPHGH